MKYPDIKEGVTYWVIDIGKHWPRDMCPFTNTLLPFRPLAELLAPPAPNMPVAYRV